MPIDNAQVVRVANEVVRPAADQLAGLCTMADQFAARVVTPEVLGPLGITMELLMGDSMPAEADYPDEVIADGADRDGRPVATNRKVLALLRVIMQFKQLKDATVGGVDRYTEAVAYALAVNPRS